MSISFNLQELHLHGIVVGEVQYNGELSEELILFRAYRLWCAALTAEKAYQDRKIPLGEFRRTVREYKDMLSFVSESLGNLEGGAQ